MALFSRNKTLVNLLAGSLRVATGAMNATADAPGRGATLYFEIHYLTTMIDHHYSALRMTELAAGTEREVNAVISPDDRIQPSPDFAPTEPHAVHPGIKSIARVDNRVQREEILMAQDMLKKWYGIQHVPKLSAKAQRDIEMLDSLQGIEFDKRFIRTMSRHHYMAAAASLSCLVARDLSHNDLRRYCQNILDAQVSDIDKMRHIGCDSYQLCDIQPQRPLPSSR